MNQSTQQHVATLTGVSGQREARDDAKTIHWQHRPEAHPKFDQSIFNNEWLAEHGYITNTPSAGRGASCFLNIDGVSLVLRHYRRGGLVRHFVEQHYVWLGLERTRAWREFAVLCELEAMGLPAPRPYACQVERQGVGYSASLITYYLAGNTLAEHICTNELSDDNWESIGRCIGTFHNAGVFHADLNAHNILLDNEHVSIIDFDRAVIDVSMSKQRFESNLSRLKRSLGKIESSGPAFYNEQNWAAVELGYKQACTHANNTTSVVD